MKSSTLSPTKAKVRPPEPLPYAENPTSHKYYCAAITGLLSQPFMTQWHPDGHQMERDNLAKLQYLKHLMSLAWNAAVYAMQELEMAQLNSTIEHDK